MERLQKILARSGVASRRASEVLIEQRRVTVNGKPARLGQQADAARDDIRVDGRRIAGAAEATWVVLNKPVGVVVSDRAQGDRPTVRTLVDLPTRLFAVGRLDVESEGLVVMTNDGEAAERLAHPRYEHEKEYRVLLNRPPDEQQLASWGRGLVLADGHRTRPARLWREAGGRSQRWLRLVLREGHKRQIRESARVLGLRVERLIRVRVGPFSLGTMKPGEWRLASQAELAQLGRPGKAPARRPSRPPSAARSPRRPRPAAARPKERR
ncbi:MAG TPA: pseudouridine synthase [Anaerolineales bacterium]|nr:pseudouridine synthase [Anaerolineales bacterium]